MTAPTIKISNLTLSFNNTTELFSNLNLEIAAGKTTCILGPSGCGKSTLLRLISGSSDFTYQGTIDFSPTEFSAAAWMSQDDLLLPWMTLQDNILLGARLRGEITGSLRRKAMDLIVKGRLKGHETALPASLSGGMRQRAALLRTLMEDRPLLLMDEPFSALDALTRIKLQNLAAEMTRGTTVLLVTHDAAEALRMADRIIILEGKPARVKKEIDFSTPTPRRPDDEEVLDHYGPLITLLLENG